MCFGACLSKSTVAFVKVSGALYSRVASSFPSWLGSSSLYLHQAAWEGFPALCQDTTWSRSLPPVPGFHARDGADGLEGSSERLQQVLLLDGRRLSLWDVCPWWGPPPSGLQCELGRVSLTEKSLVPQVFMSIPAFLLSYLMLSTRGCRRGAMNGSLVSGCMRPPFPHFRFHGYSTCETFGWSCLSAHPAPLPSACVWLLRGGLHGFRVLCQAGMMTAHANGSP